VVTVKMGSGGGTYQLNLPHNTQYGKTLIKCAGTMNYNASLMPVYCYTQYFGMADVELVYE
jgi:hypothetical protein